MLMHPSVAILSQRTASDSHALPGHVAVFDQVVYHTWRTTNCIDVLHHIFTTWLEIGKEWDSVGGFLEIVNGQLDADGVGDGEKVKHSVSRTT